MRHANRKFKLNRTSSHRRCLVANVLKALIEQERIETTISKAKHLRRYADRVITLAKRNTLASRRQAKAQLMVRYNALSPKEARRARQGDHSAYNGDRRVINKLFDKLGPRFEQRQGGYTRIVRIGKSRRGDNAEKCILEYLPE
jgi:large subunit ribosomal protein L17